MSAVAVLMRAAAVLVWAVTSLVWEVIGAMWVFTVCMWVVIAVRALKGVFVPAYGKTLKIAYVDCYSRIGTKGRIWSRVRKTLKLPRSARQIF